MSDPRSPSFPTASGGPLKSILQRMVEVRDDEIAAMIWSCAYFFFLLSSYYVLRPLRDAMGIAGGVEDLPWLYMGTLGAMLLANPLFAAVVTRWPRRVFLPVTYRFFMVNLLIFFGLLRGLEGGSETWVARGFYVWTSVFNLFAVTVFWGVMADLFREHQGRRLFGFIGVGGTLGAIAGSAVTAGLAQALGEVNLLLVTIVLLEAAVQCMHRLLRLFGVEPHHRADHAGPAARAAGTMEGGSGVQAGASRGSASGDAGAVGRAGASQASPPRGEAGGDHESPSNGEADAKKEGLARGGVLGGIQLVLRSPYLLGICLYMLLFTISSTFVYFEQASIVADARVERAARTALFAQIDLYVNLLTVVLQVLVTGRLMKRLGVSVSLTLLPALTVLGFLGLGAMPVLSMLVAFQVVRRGVDYAIARPSREVLYTVLGREGKYKAKSFIDTFIYRGGDAIGAWVYGALKGLSLGAAGVAIVAVPLGVAWMVVSWFLGVKQKHLAEEQAARGEAAS